MTLPREVIRILSPFRRPERRLTVIVLTNRGEGEPYWLALAVGEGLGAVPGAW